MSTAKQHNIVRSVEINLRVTVTNLPDMPDSVLTARLREMADNLDVIITDPTPAGEMEISYTLQIKHLQDHLIRSFHPTPF